LALLDLHSFPTRRSSDLDVLTRIRYQVLVGRLVHYLTLMGYGHSDKVRRKLKGVLRTRPYALSVSIGISDVQGVLSAAAAVCAEDRKSTRLNSSHEWISY